MKHQKKVWYNIHNGGDGSASVVFFESEELAKIDELFENQVFEQSFGEDSISYITIMSDSNIFVSDIITKKDLLEQFKEKLEYYDDEKDIKIIKSLIGKLNNV